MSNEFDTVYVVSDLHLGPGRHPQTEVYPLGENFLHDAAFLRWTQHCASDGKRSLLVLNGDIFDFLRVTDVPTDAERQQWLRHLEAMGLHDAAAKVNAPLSKSELRYGLRTNDYKTVWKLMKMAAGHAAFFTALAEWVKRGNSIILIGGNHDVELYWPLVRESIRRHIASHGADALTVERNVTFAEGSFTYDNIYLEHGHQYEYMTSVVGGPTVSGGHEINLPLGSFVNRYFINHIEKLNPFIDNIKPVNSALLALFRKHPIAMISSYFSGWKFIWKAIQSQRVLNRSVLTVAAALIIPLIAFGVIVYAVIDRNAFAEIGRKQAIITAAIAGIGGPTVLPYVLGFIGELIREVKRALGIDHKDEYLKAARELGPRMTAKGFRRAYVVFGHTHVPLVAEAGRTDPDECIYVNSGTWTAIWRNDRPDLAGRVLLSVVRFKRVDSGEFRHEQLMWDDSAGALKEAVLLV